MICPSCTVERDEKDFFKKDRCYKCIYAEKIKGCIFKKCEVCGNKCPSDRIKYCSDACLKVITKKKKKEYWTKKMRSAKRRFE